LKTKTAVSLPGRIVLMDRYYVGTLAFYWAYDQIHGTHTHNDALNWYRQSLASGKIIKPFVVFYIETPAHIGAYRKQRTLTIGATENLWINKKFLEFFSEYHIDFYAKVEPGTRVIRLTGTDSLAELKTQIKEVINEYI
jgi:thymidylate kinase